jgi:type II secretory pathway component PulK
MSALAVGRRGGRGGFALLAVLWVLTGVSALALLLTLTARDAIGTAQNRVSLIRAAWMAEGCAERARAVIAQALAEPADADSVWRVLDHVTAASPLAADCRVALRPSGVTLNVNDADAEQLRRVLGTRLPPSATDSLVDAILDWRDPDDEPRASGAEREWYRGEGRDEPRNAAFAAVAELALVRGMEALAGADSLLGVESERIVLGRAPAAVLRALPGFDGEVIARVMELRAQGRDAPTLETVAAALSAEAQQVFFARYPEIVSRVTAAPEVWTLTSVAREGTPAITATLELRLVRSGRRAAIVGRRRWP